MSSLEMEQLFELETPFKDIKDVNCSILALNVNYTNLITVFSLLKVSCFGILQQRIPLTFIACCFTIKYISLGSIYSTSAFHSTQILYLSPAPQRKTQRAQGQDAAF